MAPTDPRQTASNSSALIEQYKAEFGNQLTPELSATIDAGITFNAEGKMTVRYTDSEGERPWKPEMIFEATLCVPDFYKDKSPLNHVTIDVNHPELNVLMADLQKHKNEPEAPPMVEVPSKWRYSMWANVVDDVNSANRQELLRRHIDYYCALHAVTGKFGTPISAPFMTYVKRFRYVPPPPDIKDHKEDDEKANRGYALWLLGVRMAMKSRHQIPEGTKMLETMATFLEIGNLSDFSSLLSNIVVPLTSKFNAGLIHTQSEALIRRGMNIKLCWNDIDKKPMIPQDKDTSTFRGFKILNGSGIQPTLTDLQSYNPNFWAFAQIGVNRHGYSAMEQIDVILRKCGKTYGDVMKYFPTTKFHLFILTCMNEKRLGEIDPWRSAGHLLGNNILCPVSSSRWPEMSYIGTCMNTPDLTFDNPPPPMANVRVNQDVQIYICNMVYIMLEDWGLTEVKPTQSMATITGGVIIDMDAERRKRRSQQPVTVTSLRSALSNQNPPGPATQPVTYPQSPMVLSPPLQPPPPTNDSAESELFWEDEEEKSD